MNQTEKFMISEGVLVLAYAYEACGYRDAAAACGIVAVLSGIFFHSPKSLKRHAASIVLCIFAEAVLLACSPAQNAMPDLLLPAACSAVFAPVWMEASFKAVRPLMRIMMPASLLILACDVFISRFCGTAFSYGPAMLFLPQYLAYFMKWAQRKIRWMKRRPAARIMSIESRDAHQA